MHPLVAFLRARLDEDEAAALRAQALRDKLDDAHRQIDRGIRDGAEYAWREAAVNPVRVLREVEAKRAILAQWEASPSDSPVLTFALYSLAAVYRDHPDYDQDRRESLHLG
jgi:hypothetical protein